VRVVSFDNRLSGSLFLGSPNSAWHSPGRRAVTPKPATTFPIPPAPGEGVGSSPHIIYGWIAFLGGYKQRNSDCFPWGFARNTGVTGFWAPWRLTHPGPCVRCAVHSSFTVFLCCVGVGGWPSDMQAEQWNPACFAFLGGTNNTIQVMGLWAPWGPTQVAHDSVSSASRIICVVNYAKLFL